MPKIDGMQEVYVGTITSSDAKVTLEEQIRQIVREEIAAIRKEEQRLAVKIDPDAVAEALGKHLRNQRIKLGTPDPFDRLESAETPEIHE